MEYNETYCKYFCTAPDTECEHWQGTFCDLDLENHNE